MKADKELEFERNAADDLVRQAMACLIGAQAIYTILAMHIPDHEQTFAINPSRRVMCVKEALTDLAAFRK